MCTCTKSFLDSGIADKLCPAGNLWIYNIYILEREKNICPFEDANVLISMDALIITLVQGLGTICDLTTFRRRIKKDSSFPVSVFVTFADSGVLKYTHLPC